MNLRDGRTYCLPDGYEVRDNSLRDVQFCLSPSFTFSAVARLNFNTSLARDVYGVSYLPGFIGLNNLSCTDDLSVLLHALAHVTPFRDFWLLHRMEDSTSGYTSCSNLARQFGLVLRKMWSGGNFKSNVSPQELVQEIAVQSGKRFNVGTRSDCMELFVWLLRQLHVGLGLNKEKASLVYEPFQGRVEVLTLKKKLVSGIEELKQGNAEELPTEEWTESTAHAVPFSFLSVDLPPCPLFRDSHGGFVIPQLPLFEVLRRKFDGQVFTDLVTKEAHERRRYRITRLPQYLVLQLVRFTKNNFCLEKNPTIVTFPVKNLEMKDYLFAASPGSGEAWEREQRERQEALDSCPTATQLRTMGPDELTQLVRRIGTPQMVRDLDLGSPSDTTETVRDRVLALAEAAVDRVQLFRSTKYDLLASICHDSSESSQSVTVGDVNMAAPASSAANSKGSGRKAPLSLLAGSGNVLNQGCYKVHLQNKATGQWYEMQDLHVAETTPQLIGISESYILIYEKKRPE